MEYLSTCGLVRTTCHRSYMWHRRDVISIQEGVHVFLSPPVDQRPVPLIQVLLARDDADGSCCMSARNVWQGEERLTRRTGGRIVQAVGRDACGTFRAGVPHFSCRCSGGIPAGMRTLELSVGTIILERDKKMSVNNKNRSRGGAYQVISRQWSFGSFYVYVSFPVFFTLRVKKKCVAMHKKGARSRKILLPPLADIVNTHTERQDFVNEMA